mgnify:CR=1 FL=1
MSDREIYEIIKKNEKSLTYKYLYEAKDDKPYKLLELKNLRKNLKNLHSIPLFEDAFSRIEKTGFFDSPNDVISFNVTNYSTITSAVGEMNIFIKYFINHFESNNRLNDENSLNIKLPQLDTFSDLSKVSNEFKRAIEIPLLDSKIDSELKIITAEKGSIWLYVSLGAPLAVSLIASITWSAAVLRRKKAEADIFEAHTRTLDLKNDMMETFVNAQKVLVQKVLQDEAESIATKDYSEVTPETIERLKLSISTVSELIDKGAKILPTSNSEDVKKLFPDFEKLSLIQSAIKKIS